VVILLAVLGLFIWAGKHMTNDYAITPGVAQPVGPLITVAGHPHGATRASILLTDVYLTQLTVWQWVWAQIHPGREERIVSLSTLTGGDVPASQLVTQAYLQMFDSQNAAKVAAMRALGLRVVGSSVGATVWLVAADAPSAGVLSVDDRIVWARGKPVRNECQLLQALDGAAPGSRVALKIERVKVSSSGVFGAYAPPATVEVPIGLVPPKAPSSGCPGNPTTAVSFALGIELEDATQWHFPVHVSINTANIGGPSAGLAMTLGIIDALSTTSITGGLKIAATGTIDPSGHVGDVGGVPQKTIAVENAGATVFLVPKVELGPAEGAASPGLTVIPVTTLQQALAAIERLGRRVPERISGPVRSGSARA
jgi:PDZ domain-containing protein